MTITAIKAQAKNPERLSVFVDQAYAFSLTYNQLLEQKLHAGMAIDQARLVELKRASDFGKAYDRALNYVMIRPRSVREVRDYARRKQWAPEDTELIIQKLQARRYLDDHNFARAWVQNRVLGGKTSERKLRMELKQKGVADDVIARALAESSFSETDALQAIVAKKRKLARYANDEQKLMQYLARQGFSFDDIKEALGK